MPGRRVRSSPPDPSQSNVFDGGTSAHNDAAVEVRTGVTYSTISKPIKNPVQACKDKSKTPSAYTDAITIKIKCTKHPHLVQFIYREQIGADGKALSAPITTTGGTYNLTTDPAKPNWNTDSAAKPNANYEAAGVHRSDSNALTTMDQPSLRPPTGGTARTTFKAFAICNGKVVREVDWIREQKDGSSPTYHVNVSKADKMPDWANAQLKTQGFKHAP